MEPTQRSKVWGREKAAAAGAPEYFANKLTHETDAADVCADMRAGSADFVLADARSAEDYAEAHIHGAISLPHARITRERMAEFPEDTRFVVYCWGPGCNGSTKAAIKLAQMGYAVKEMIGGIEYWRRDGFPIAEAGD